MFNIAFPQNVNIAEELHDLSYKGVALTFSAVQKDLLNLTITTDNLNELRSIIDGGTGFKVKVAILLSMQASGHLTKVFAELESSRKSETNIEYRMMTTEDSAMNWLAQDIEKS